MDHPALNVSSSCPSNPSFSFSLPLPAPASSSSADKASALAALHDAIASAQASINQKLTARMEEDKLRAAAAAEAEGRTVAGPAIDEDKEEQNYGEEVQEEDED